MHFVVCQNVLNHFYATILPYKAHCSDERGEEGGGQHSCLEGKQFKQFTTYFTVKERKGGNLLSDGGGGMGTVPFLAPGHA